MSIDTQAYLFVHFIGEERNPTDEQLYFALSRDGVHWRDLRPAGSPALTWLGGEKGVRDPHIVRDPRGGFHIVATDLSIYYRGGWGPNDGATTNGSTGLVIWDSPDLVHWSEPRLVDVASKIPDAGMAWAPEANWDPDRGQWIVFWSTKSNAESSADPLANELGDPTNVYYATTVDFRVFSDPVKWIDRKNVIIDSTMLRDDDGWWYRASKDSEITIERTRNPYATTYEVLRTDDPNEWSYVGTLTDIFGNGRYSMHYLEGPELFRYNDEDVKVVNGRTMPFGLMCDQYAESKGYLSFRAASLASHDPADWQRADDIDFGALKKRHGAILPITAAEYDAIETAFALKAARLPIRRNRSGAADGEDAGGRLLGGGRVEPDRLGVHALDGPRLGVGRMLGNGRIREDLLDMAVLGQRHVHGRRAAATPDNDVIARIVVLRREE